MDDNFGDWYRVAELIPNHNDLVNRQTAIEAFAEPLSLLGENVGHIPVTQFSYERRTWKFRQSFTLRNCSSKLFRIAIFLDQWMTSAGRQQKEDEIPT